MPSPTRPTIFVIEPHDATRELWASVLRSLNCCAIAVATVSDAVQALEQVVPDLVITELVQHLCKAAAVPIRERDCGMKRYLVFSRILFFGPRSRCGRLSLPRNANANPHG